MPLEPKKSRIALFFAVGIGLALLMAGLKALFAWVVHTYAYSVPWIGGFLKSIEIAEISNLLAFAILGASIGAATILLPASWNNKIKLAFVLVLSPFVFSASYMMQQHLWIQQVASRGNISYREAKTVTNRYLERETGKSGFWGFYPFSTQLAEMPTRLEVLRSEQSMNPNKLLTQELSAYDDPRADLAAYVFERIGWLIRFMYMTIAALTAVIYYFKGASWADTRRAERRRPAAGASSPAIATPVAVPVAAPVAAQSPVLKDPVLKGKPPKSNLPKRKGAKRKGEKGKGAKSNVSEAHLSKSNPSGFGVSDPKRSKPKSSEPKSSEPKSLEPKSLEPKLSVSKSSELSSSEPNSSATKLQKPLIGKPSRLSTAKAIPDAASAPTQATQTPTPRQKAQPAKDLPHDDSQN